ncbi:DUF411 domain-containing protein [Patescibacteria group bacterium]
MKTRNILLAISLLGLILMAGLFIYKPKDNEVNANEINATVYKSPTCGCCIGYMAEAEKSEINVETVTTKDMELIKEQYNIPREMESCHTMIIDDYFVEGHVPFEAIEKLLAEKPDIDGIALPDMPAGSPGMPGIKTGSYEIYQLKDGVYSNFLSI